MLLFLSKFFNSMVLWDLRRLSGTAADDVCLW